MQNTIALIETPATKTRYWHCPECGATHRTITPQESYRCECGAAMQKPLISRESADALYPGWDKST